MTYRIPRFELQFPVNISKRPWRARGSVMDENEFQVFGQIVIRPCLQDFSYKHESNFLLDVFVVLTTDGNPRLQNQN